MPEEIGETLCETQETGLNIFFQTPDRMSGRNNVTPDKANFMPDIRQNVFQTLRLLFRTSKLFVVLKAMLSYYTLINIKLRKAHVHQHPIEPQQFLKTLNGLLFSSLILKSQGGFILSISFQGYVITYKMFSEEKLSQVGQKAKVLL